MNDNKKNLYETVADFNILSTKIIIIDGFIFFYLFTIVILYMSMEVTATARYASCELSIMWLKSIIGNILYFRHRAKYE